MNTFLLQNDNQIILSTQSPIMEKSNCVDEIQFITPKFYNELAMEEFDLVLEYLTPISKNNRIETLVLVDNNYKEDYLRYSLPVTTDITKECGTVGINLSFLKVELDSNGGKIKRVRNFSQTFLNIVPISSWFHVSDDGLTQLAELYLNNKSQIEALKSLAEIIYDSKADDIAIDIDGKKLRLKNNGKFINNGIDLEILNQELIEVGSNTTGNIKIQKI